MLEIASNLLCSSSNCLITRSNCLKFASNCLKIASNLIQSASNCLKGLEIVVNSFALFQITQITLTLMGRVWDWQGSSILEDFRIPDLEKVARMDMFKIMVISFYYCMAGNLRISKPFGAILKQFEANLTQVSSS